jgi:hypothetical protein
MSKLMPHLLERVEGVEPSSLAWKARVIAVIRHPPGTSLTHNYKLIYNIAAPPILLVGRDGFEPT